MYALLKQASARPYLPRIRVILLCFSVGANALCAGGVFCFPIISPTLAMHLKFTQPQLSTIAMVGLMGQYPFGAIVGKILDRYGAWACSLIAACLFSAGFGLFANEISMTPGTVTQPSIYTFHHLVIYFFICGVGITFSYFASVFAASKNFPDYIGMSAGASTALFGLSPTFFSILASRYFSFPDGQIDVTHFLQFVAILSGCLHLIGGLTMHIIPSATEEEPHLASLTSDPETPDERTMLLPNKANGSSDQVQVDVIPVSDEYPESKYNALSVLTDRNFLALTFTMFIILGSCEMIISNIGTIILSLPSQKSSLATFPETLSPLEVTANQVRMLSIANTLSRLLIGPLADFVSPVPSRHPGPLSQHRISRVVFLALSAMILLCSYTWMIVGVKDQTSIWPLSVGTGLAYGCAFTTFPSLTASIWGLPNLARNFGIMTYAPFMGTPAFSYLYAFVSAAHVESDLGRDEVCYGPACWKLTFEVSALSTTLALGTSVYLWRVWKGRV